MKLTENELLKREEDTIEVAGDCGLSYVGKNEDGKLEFLGDQEAWDSFDEVQNCDHDCTSDCRREGCNCACGEWHLGSLAKTKRKEVLLELKRDKQL